MKYLAPLLLFFSLLFSLPLPAHDLDPNHDEWFRGLMQPDNPNQSCCGLADAYWADAIHVRGDKTYAVITDDRDDAPLERRHIPVGTENEIPNNKLKWDRGNPTGHNVIFHRRRRALRCALLRAEYRNLVFAAHGCRSLPSASFRRRAMHHPW